MKILSILATLYVLTGCVDTNTEQRQTCSGEHSYTESQTDQYGLTLLPTDSMYLTVEQTTQAYEEVMACMGMAAYGPTVEFVSFSERFHVNDTGGGAFYHIPNQHIFINNDSSDMFPRDCKSDTELLKHEMVHHVLQQNGFGTESSQHDPDYFLWQCITD